MPSQCTANRSIAGQGISDSPPFYMSQHLHQRRLLIPIPCLPIICCPASYKGSRVGVGSLLLPVKHCPVRDKRTSSSVQTLSVGHCPAAPHTGQHPALMVSFLLSPFPFIIAPVITPSSCRALGSPNGRCRLIQNESNTSTTVASIRGQVGI